MLCKCQRGCEWAIPGSSGGQHPTMIGNKWVQAIDWPCRMEIADISATYISVFMHLYLIERASTHAVGIGKGKLCRIIVVFCSLTAVIKTKRFNQKKRGEKMHFLDSCFFGGFRLAIGLCGRRTLKGIGTGPRGSNCDFRLINCQINDPPATKISD